jgi:TolA-binding protein
MKILLLAALSLLLIGCFRTRADIAREREETELRSNIHQSVAEQSQSMEKLQADIGRLQGRIEELEHQRRKEMTGISASRENADKSIDDLRTRVDKLAETQQDLFEEVKKLKEENIQQLRSQAERPKAIAPAHGKKPMGFEDGLAAYKVKNYESATEAFRSYLTRNPKGKKSLDAHYYLGDSLYHSRAFPEAIVEFGVVHEKSLKTTLGRKSTLRIAESFRALGKEKDAKAFAQILVETSPNSEEAKAARKFLK